MTPSASSSCAACFARRVTITEAASMSDLTREALSKAIKKPWVREHMISLIQQWLGVSALKASSKMDSLMNSDNPMAAFQENSETLPP